MTCEKYHERVKTIKETWLKNINSNSDYRFVSSVSKIEEKKLGYNTPDEYEYAPLKNWFFIKNFDFENYDWVFICDDDLYCFPKRLENLLSNYNHEQLSAIGEKLTAKVDMYHYFRTSDNIKYPVDFFAGGGGYAVSKSSILKIKDWMSKQENPEWSFHTDVSFGHWFSLNNINLINKKEYFGSQHWTNHSYSQEDCFPNPSNEKVSYHYCKDEDMRNLYENFDI